MKFKRHLTIEERQANLESLKYTLDSQNSLFAALNYEALQLMRDEAYSIVKDVQLDIFPMENHLDTSIKMYLAENNRMAKQLHEEIKLTEAEITKYAFNLNVIEALTQKHDRYLAGGIGINGKDWENLYWNEIDEFDSQTKIQYISTKNFTHYVYAGTPPVMFIPLADKQVEYPASFDFKRDVYELIFKRIGFSPEITLVYDYLPQTNTLYFRRNS